MTSPQPLSGRPVRPHHTAAVVSQEWLTPAMVRVVFDVPLDAPELFADSYVKLLFDGVQRAYTIRSLEGARMTIDFVVHGDEGLAGPWAANAVPGDILEFVGPGGEWSPRPDADWHLFIGDESALPAIASGLELMPTGSKALVFAEVGAAEQEYPLAAGDVTWVHRDGAEYGEKLVAAVLAATLPQGDAEVFLHGNAEMVRPLRRYLLGELGVPRQHLSVSGYWRAGHTDEAWRASKREFNAQMEQD
ncbi:siderophore-interacting protein [Demequina sp.]|uniref:siderophore-interacting protein n=1 Tax=Demequina sp. TaxID=2050685 RepID=UPI003D13C67A